MRGSSLLEIIIGLLISGLVIGLAIKGIKLAGHSYIKSTNTLNEEVAFQKVYGYLQLALEYLDKHTLNLPPIIHNSGEISFADQSKLVISNKNYQPDLESNALSFLNVEILEAQRVRKTENLRGDIKFTLCPVFQNDYHSGKHKSYIGVNSFGFFELEKIKSLFFPDTKCREIIFRPILGIFSKEAAKEELETISLILPILSVNSIYLDKQQNLRLISHLGTKTLENQPLTKGIEKLNFTANFSDDLHLFKYNASLEFLETNTRTISFTNSVSRKNFINLLLQIK